MSPEAPELPARLAINELFSVAGKTALVTGGSRGIGRMLAQGLIENGAKVYIAARTPSEVHDATASLSTITESCVGIVADISTIAGIKRLCEELNHRETGLDILVNNAGVSGVTPIETCSEQVWDQMFNVNVKAPFFLTQAPLPLLRARATRDNPARILCTASGSGLFIGYPNMFGYEASKAACIHLVRSLASSLAAYNINVNAMVPGTVLTEKLQAYIDRSGAKLLDSTPTGKWTGAEEVVGMMLYCCSRAGANTTGEVLSADGGQQVMPKMRG